MKTKGSHANWVITEKNVVFFKKITGDDAKKGKKIDWNTSFHKNIFIKIVFKKTKVTQFLNQSTIERSPLIHGQINLIKFVESNKFDKVYSKIWNIFAWSIFLKIWHVLIHQISWMKNIKSNFKSPQRRKIEENKTTNESIWNIFIARFSFCVFASLTFIIYFVISLFSKANNLPKHSGVILNFILFLLF